MFLIPQYSYCETLTRSDCASFPRNAENQADIFFALSPQGSLPVHSPGPTWSCSKHFPSRQSTGHKLGLGNKKKQKKAQEKHTKTETIQIYSIASLDGVRYCFSVPLGPSERQEKKNSAKTSAFQSGERYAFLYDFFPPVHPKFYCVILLRYGDINS